jgi:hypothetical protein
MSRGIWATISIFVIGILVVVAGFFLLGIERTTLKEMLNKSRQREAINTYSFY